MYITRNLAGLIIALGSIVAVTSLFAAEFEGETRSLEQVFSESDVVLYGAVQTARIGECKGLPYRTGIYKFRVDKVLKGGLKKKYQTLCGNAPFLMTHRYVIAGKLNDRNQLIVKPDAVLAEPMTGAFYRAASYRLPAFDSSEGEVYGFGLREPDLAKRFPAIFGQLDPHSD